MYEFIGEGDLLKHDGFSNAWWKMEDTKFVHRPTYLPRPTRCMLVHAKCGGVRSSHWRPCSGPHTVANGFQSVRESVLITETVIG